MVTKRQTTAAKSNIKKGRRRQKPGATGKGKFYRIEVRPKGEFTSFRVQDVGKRGGLERLAGRRSSGSWDTVSWLVSKTAAKINPQGKLVITDPKARTALKQISGRIIHVKGDIFKAHPRKNVAEKDKPTPAMRRAERANIKKAQAARKKRR